MFNMSLPWSEFVIRAVCVYLFLLIGLKLTGKRQIGQLAPFDLVLLLILSNAVQNSMNGGDNSLIGGFILAGTLILLNSLVGYLSFRFRKVEKFIDGKPEVIIWNGHLYEKPLAREQISKQELQAAIRKAGGESISNVHFAVLEVNGGISVKLK